MLHVRQKQALRLLLVQLVLIVVNTGVFAAVWYCYYADRLDKPFYAKGDYAVGLSYLDQTGTVVNSGYDRLNVNLKLNQNIKPWLKIGTSTNFSMANSDMIKTATSNQNNGDEGVIRSALYYPPLYRIEEQPGYEEYQLVSNPLDYTAAMNKNKNYTIYSSNYANATLTKGLIFRTVFSYKASMNFNNRYFPKNLSFFFSPFIVNSHIIFCILWSITKYQLRIIDRKWNDIKIIDANSTF